VRLHHLHRDLVRHCDLRQHRAARLRERVRQQQRLGLRALLVHLQLCSAIRGPARLLPGPGKGVPVRRKACARLARHNNIVRAARPRVVPAVRQGSVQVDRRRGSRSVLEAAADRVVVTTKDR